MRLMNTPLPRPRKPRKPKLTPSPRGDGFTVTSRLTEATGNHGHHALDYVQALPGPRSNTVVLQASDGHQAVCLVTPGELDQAAFLPRRLLRNMKTTEDLEVRRTPDGWSSSNGQSAKPSDPQRFPDIAEALPQFSSRRDADDHLSLSVDVSLLVKITEALGTSKLNLLVPKPDAGEATVSKAIAVCPATKPEGRSPHGVAVLMPCTADQGVKYYRKVRRDVAAAEKAAKARPVSPSA